MLSDEEKRYLNKCLKKICGFFFILFLIAFVAYSCDLDFSVREKYLSKDNTVYPEEFIKTPIQKQNVLYNKELGLEVIGKFQTSGLLLGANPDIVRTNCPFQKERVALYNKYFLGLMILTKNKPLSFAAIPQGRLVKQILSKLANDDSFLRQNLRHKITFFGYTLKLRDYPDIEFDHVVIDKIILNGKVYQ